MNLRFTLFLIILTASVPHYIIAADASVQALAHLSEAHELTSFPGINDDDRQQTISEAEQLLGNGGSLRAETTRSKKWGYRKKIAVALIAVNTAGFLGSAIAYAASLCNCDDSLSDDCQSQASLQVAGDFLKGFLVSTVGSLVVAPILCLLETNRRSRNNHYDDEN